jgi:hypothetical protein
MAKDKTLSGPRDKMAASAQKQSGLDFNGQAGNGVNRDGNRFAGNYAGLDMKENFGSGPRSTKALRQPGDHGKSVTFDAYREAPSTASGKKPNEGPFQHLAFGNPDKINVGSK